MSANAAPMTADETRASDDAFIEAAGYNTQLPGFLECLINAPTTWNAWVAMSADERRAAFEDNWLRRNYPGIDFDSHDIQLAKENAELMGRNGDLLALIGEQREATEDILLLLAARGSRSAAQALQELRKVWKGAR